MAKHRIKITTYTSFATTILGVIAMIASFTLYIASFDKKQAINEVAISNVRNANESAVTNLRNDLCDLRTEMNARFDKMEQKLDRCKA